NVVLFWVFIPYRTQQRFMLQALGLAVVPLAAFLERGPWRRNVAALLLGLHLLTPQGWPFPARVDSDIPWDLTPMIPNAVGAPLVLFLGLEPSPRVSPSVGLGLRPFVLGVVFLTVFMVWACCGARVHLARASHRRLLVSAATLSFLGGTL